MIRLKEAPIPVFLSTYGLDMWFRARNHVGKRYNKEIFNWNSFVISNIIYPVQANTGQSYQVNYRARLLR